MAELLKHTLGNSERVFYGNSLADWVAAGVVAVALALQNVLGDLFASLSSASCANNPMRASNAAT
jgi:hypothetical protein